MLAYRNPSNEDSDSIFNYTLKLDAYVLPMLCVTDEYVDMIEKEIELILSDANIEDTENTICSFILSNIIEMEHMII